MEIEEKIYETICDIRPLLEPEPYTEDVLKHQEHDQSSHGNWADGSIEFTIEEIDNELPNTVDIDLKGNFPTTRIRFEELDSKVPDGVKQKIYETVAELQARFPIEKASITIDDNLDTNNERVNFESENIVGYCKIGEPKITLRTSYLAEKGIGNRSADNSMPSENQTNATRWIIAHEWGHAMDKRNDTQYFKDQESIAETQTYLSRMGTMPKEAKGYSAYGLQNSYESYAEAFAEYFVSGENTTSSYTKDFAKRYGWDKVKKDVSKAMPRNVAILDTFDVKNPPQVIFLDIAKHLSGQHDQSTHGSWAEGMESELANWSPKDKVPDAPRNAAGTTDKFWDNWEHGVDGDQFVDLYRQYAGEMLGLPVPKSDKDVGGSENYLTQRGFGGSSTETVRKQTEAVLNAIANGRPQPTLYRGLVGNDEAGKALLEQFTKLEVGDTIDMPLVSTSRSLGVAQWYAADRSIGENKVILKIQEGAKGVTVNREKSYYPSDFETVISGKFEVVGTSEVTVPYWSRRATHARTFELRDGQTGYRIQDPNDLSWDGLESDSPKAKARYDIIKNGANTGDFAKIETATLKYTNDRQPSGVKDGRDITVNSWVRKEPKTFTVIEVKMIEPHVVRKGADLGVIFHNLFNDVPFIRDEEEVLKHGNHDQKTHGNWASGNYEDLAQWYSDEMQVFGSMKERDEYFEKMLLSQREKGFTEEKYPEFRRAIGEYESAIGYSLNDALRDPQVSESAFRDTIEYLDKAIETAPALSEEVIAYRGIKGNGLNFFEKLKVGDVFEDKGYVSTTIDAGVAQQFGTSGSLYQGLAMRLRLPAGSKGIFPAGYKDQSEENWDRNANEAEFLLPRGSKFKVVAIRGKVWDVELIP